MAPQNISEYSGRLAVYETSFEDERIVVNEKGDKINPGELN